MENGKLTYGNGELAHGNEKLTHRNGTTNPREYLYSRIYMVIQNRPRARKKGDLVSWI